MIINKIQKAIPRFPLIRNLFQICIKITASTGTKLNN